MKDNLFVRFLKNGFPFFLRGGFPIKPAEFGHKLSHFFCHVRFQIVQNHMNFGSSTLVFFCNQIQKFTELFCPVAVKHLAQNFACMRVESCKKRLRSMTNVLKLSQYRISRNHWSVWMKALKRLHPCFLIDAENNTFRRRLQIKSHDVKHLFSKERVFGIQPILPLPGLQSSFFEPPVNRCDRNRFDNSLFNSRALEFSQAPSFKSPSDFSWWFQKQLNERMLFFRKKNRLAPLLAEGLSIPEVDLSETVSAIFQRCFYEFSNLWQFEHWKHLSPPEESPVLSGPPSEGAYNSALSFQDLLSHPVLIQAELVDVLSRESPPEKRNRLNVTRTYETAY